jgi:hypothetical protein
MLKVDVMELNRVSFDDQVLQLERNISESKQKDLESKRFDTYTPKPAPIAANLNLPRTLPKLTETGVSQQSTSVLEFTDLRTRKTQEGESAIELSEQEQIR